MQKSFSFIFCLLTRLWGLLVEMYSPPTTPPYAILLLLHGRHESSVPIIPHQMHSAVGSCPGSFEPSSPAAARSKHSRYGGIDPPVQNRHCAFRNAAPVFPPRSSDRLQESSRFRYLMMHSTTVRGKRWICTGRCKSWITCSTKQMLNNYRSPIDLASFQNMTVGLSLQPGIH